MFWYLSRYKVWHSNDQKNTGTTGVENTFNIVVTSALSTPFLRISEKFESARAEEDFTHTKGARDSQRILRYANSKIKSVLCQIHKLLLGNFYDLIKILAH